MGTREVTTGLRAMSLVLLVTEHATFADDDPALWMHADDGRIALAIRDLADSAVCDAMYEGMESLVPVGGHPD